MTPASRGIVMLNSTLAVKLPSTIAVSTPASGSHEHIPIPVVSLITPDVAFPKNRPAARCTKTASPATSGRFKVKVTVTDTLALGLSSPKTTLVPVITPTRCTLRTDVEPTGPVAASELSQIWFSLTPVHPTQVPQDAAGTISPTPHVLGPTPSAGIEMPFESEITKVTGWPPYSETFSVRSSSPFAWSQFPLTPCSSPTLAAAG
mmetsp:Transcript_8250/g.16153  ORF Transcript_8250/g.16153 Transcript_8250/m.16153 type:complete len:205 (-) Transcript_8250:395-1009(-)